MHCIGCVATVAAKTATLSRPVATDNDGKCADCLLRNRNRNKLLDRSEDKAWGQFASAMLMPVIANTNAIVKKVANDEARAVAQPLETVESASWEAADKSPWRVRAGQQQRQVNRSREQTGVNIGQPARTFGALASLKSAARVIGRVSRGSKKRDPKVEMDKMRCVDDSYAYAPDRLNRLPFAFNRADCCQDEGQDSST